MEEINIYLNLYSKQIENSKRMKKSKRNTWKALESVTVLQWDRWRVKKIDSQKMPTDISAPNIAAIMLKNIFNF